MKTLLWVDKCLTYGYKLPIYASQSANPIERDNILKLFKNYEQYYEKSNILYASKDEGARSKTSTR